MCFYSIISTHGKNRWSAANRGITKTRFIVHTAWAIEYHGYDMKSLERKIGSQANLFFKNAIILASSVDNCVVADPKQNRSRSIYNIRYCPSIPERKNPCPILKIYVTLSV
mmetsp:Transcript_41678/g.87478  ORF Transcript_41678/g.87478 Transcript_41678/m.87478 type:complete len:111 (-) Transcript_41678:163-495(-)